MSHVSIGQAKKKLGAVIREIAEGNGALPSNPTHAQEICLKDFEAAAGEWAYDLIRKIVLDGTGAWEDENIPRYLVLDTEEEWASYITSEQFLDLLPN